MPQFHSLIRAVSRMAASISGTRSRTVVVEGNIASGKTVLLEYFQKFPTVKVFPESVAEWQNVNGFNLLDLLYRDSKRWTFAFQLYADLTRLSQHQSNEKLETGDVKLMERSLYSGKYVFAENSYRSGSIEPAEYAVLNSYFDWMTSKLHDMLRVDLIVYLRAKPEMCYQRLQKRCRSEETAIPLEYLTALHHHYEEWLIEKKRPLPAEVVVIDANESLSSMYSVYDKLASKILSPAVGISLENDDQSRPCPTNG